MLLINYEDLHLLKHQSLKKARRFFKAMKIGGDWRFSAYAIVRCLREVRWFLRMATPSVPPFYADDYSLQE